jgi:hypothetical protein
MPNGIAGMDSDNILLKILEWAWIAMAGGMLHLYRKAFGLETRSQLLEQDKETRESQRKEDLKLRSEQRAEIIDTISNHHNDVMKRIDTLEVIVKKNGH